MNYGGHLKSVGGLRVEQRWSRVRGSF